MSIRRLIRQGMIASTLLLAAGLVRAEETHQVLTAISSTTLNGYVDTSAIWVFGSDGPGVAAIPEPCTTVLLAAGIFGSWLVRGIRSRRHKLQR